MADDAGELYRRACSGFDRLVQAITDSDWDAPTVCHPWSVRDLVNHLAVEDLWAAELFRGRTLADVGSAFDGDQLGADPLTSWTEALRAALAAVAEPGSLTRIVGLSFGEVPGHEYAMQLFADHLVHSWDLACALGVDRRLDDELVRACREWFSPIEDAYRAAGAIGARPPVPADADEQTLLLAAFGRSA